MSYTPASTSQRKSKKGLNLSPADPLPSSTEGEEVHSEHAEVKTNLFGETETPGQQKYEYPEGATKTQRSNIRKRAKRRSANGEYESPDGKKTGLPDQTASAVSAIVSQTVKQILEGVLPALAPGRSSHEGLISKAAIKAAPTLSTADSRDIMKLIKFLKKVEDLREDNDDYRIPMKLAQTRCNKKSAQHQIKQIIGRGTFNLNDWTHW